MWSRWRHVRCQQRCAGFGRRDRRECRLERQPRRRRGFSGRRRYGWWHRGYRFGWRYDDCAARSPGASSPSPPSLHPRRPWQRDSDESVAADWLCAPTSHPAAAQGEASREHGSRSVDRSGRRKYWSSWSRRYATMLRDQSVARRIENARISTEACFDHVHCHRAAGRLWRR